MALNCDLQALITASKDFLEPNISQAEREAIAIYLKAQGLAAGGGSDLTAIEDLLEAAKEWQTLVQNQRAAIDLQVTLENAQSNGATIDTGIQDLKDDSRCIACLPAGTRATLLAFLRCALSEQGLPD